MNQVGSSLPLGVGGQMHIYISKGYISLKYPIFQLDSNRDIVVLSFYSPLRNVYSMKIKCLTYKHPPRKTLFQLSRIIINVLLKLKTNLFQVTYNGDRIDPSLMVLSKDHVEHRSVVIGVAQSKNL